MHELGPFITVVSWSRWVFLVSQDTPSGDAIRQAVLKLLRDTPCDFLHLITGYGVASLCGVISAHHISVRIHVCHDIAAVTLWEGHPKFLTLFDFFLSYVFFVLSLNPLLRPKTTDLEQRLKISSRLFDVEFHLPSYTTRGQYLSVPDALSLTSLYHSLSTLPPPKKTVSHPFKLICRWNSPPKLMTSDVKGDQGALTVAEHVFCCIRVF